MSTVTYNGVTLTKAIDRVVGTTTDLNVEIWYGLEAILPATGTDSVVVDCPNASGEDDILAAAIAVTGAAQAAPEDVASIDDGETAATTAPVAAGTINYRSIGTDSSVLYAVGHAGQGSWDLSLEKVVNGTPTDIATPIDNEGSAPGQVDSEDVWYTLKVEVSGTSIKCYLDDILKFDITDSTYSDGTVGVWSLSERCWWDNMLVSTGVGGDFHILSRDNDTQVTVQETAGSTLTDLTYTIERAYNTMQAWEDGQQGGWSDGDAITVEDKYTRHRLGHRCRRGGVRYGQARYHQLA